jgi:cysteine desulfurase
MLANNETGVLQPIEVIAERVHARGRLLHVDATQAVGKIPVDVGRLGADLLSASAHKFNGPKGAGFLFQQAGVELAPHIQGGPQERRRRGGTENLAGIVGLGVACALAASELPERADRYARLRDRLWEGIRSKVSHVRRNGSERHVLPNTLNVEFAGTAGEVLLEALDLEGISVSAGAACHSGSIEASHVLTAMGCSPEQARASLRFSVGYGVDEAQIDRVLAVLPDLVTRVREAGGS